MTLQEIARLRTDEYIKYKGTPAKVVWVEFEHNEERKHVGMYVVLKDGTDVCLCAGYPDLSLNLRDFTK